MKKLWLSSLILCSLTAAADVLSPEDALARALAECPSTTVRKKAAKTPGQPVLTIGQTPELYVFASAESGAVVASAESEGPALLGYSENYSEEMPPAMQWLLRSYAQDIAALRAGDVIPIAQISSRADFDAISPICKTTWNQDSPYNDDCPKLNNKRTYSGCVATAVAQVIKVYKYPEKCSGGTYSYKWSNGNQTLSKNFDTVKLDWANMTNSYSSVSSSTKCAAVANLMSAVGYASNMNYGTDGSGTNGIYAAQGLIRNFGYDYSMQYYSAEWFSLSDWQQMVYNELAAGYPVYYEGVNTKENVGHAFVVDGYKSDGFFHLNWGWGGMLDGYFLLTALDPQGNQGIGGSGGGYSEMSSAMLNLRAGQTVSADKAPLTFVAEYPLIITSKGTKSKVSFELDIYSKTPFDIPGFYAALRFTADNGKKYYSQPIEIGACPPYGLLRSSMNVAIDNSIPNGSYVVELIVENLNGDEYPVFYPQGYDSKKRATVNGDNITFSKYEEAAPGVLGFNSVQLPATITLGTPFDASAILTNGTSTAYQGAAHLNIYRKGTTQRIAYWATNDFTLAAGQNININLGGALIEVGELDPGTYTFGFSTADGTIVSETKDIKVVMPVAELEAENFTVSNWAVNEVTFSLDLKNISNADFSGPVIFAVARSLSSAVLWSDAPEKTIPAGQSIKISYTLNLEKELTEGTTYLVYGGYTLPDGSKPNFSGTKSAKFTAKPATSGISEVAGDETPGEYFDLLGRRVKGSSTGVLIRRQGANTQTIIR